VTQGIFRIIPKSHFPGYHLFHPGVPVHKSSNSFYKNAIPTGLLTEINVLHILHILHDLYVLHVLHVLNVLHVLKVLHVLHVLYVLNILTPSLPHKPPGCSNSFTRNINQVFSGWQHAYF